jgi:hypothetical protein
MATALLGPARPQTTGLDAARRRQLTRLLEQLECWLPLEEQRLTAARERSQPLLRQEDEWQRLLGLYERLSRSLA